MAIAAKDEVTAAQAARELDLSMEAFLELVYSGAVRASVDRRSGRVLVPREEIGRLRRERPSQQTS